MKISELQRLLAKQDPDAEVMVSVDMMLSRSAPRPGTLSLPTRTLDTGTFQSGDMLGRPWVSIIACDAWGLSPPRGHAPDCASYDFDPEKQLGPDKACDCADRGPGGIATPWPARDVVDKLAEAASILLVDKDYDGHGWELIDTAMKVAQAWLRVPPAPRSVNATNRLCHSNDLVSLIATYAMQRVKMMTARPAMWGGDLAVETQLMLLLELESVLRDGEPAHVNRIWTNALRRFRTESLASSLSVTHGGEHFGLAAKAVFDIAREIMLPHGVKEARQQDLQKVLNAALAIAESPVLTSDLMRAMREAMGPVTCPSCRWVKYIHDDPYCTCSCHTLDAPTPPKCVCTMQEIASGHRSDCPTLTPQRGVQ